MSLKLDVEKRANEKLAFLLKHAEPVEEPIPSEDKGEILDGSYSPKVEGESDDNGNEFTGLLAKVLSGQIPSKTTSTTSSSGNVDGLRLPENTYETQTAEDIPIGELISALNPSHIVDQNIGEQ